MIMMKAPMLEKIFLQNTLFGRENLFSKGEHPLFRGSTLFIRETIFDTLPIFFFWGGEEAQVFGEKLPTHK